MILSYNWIKEYLDLEISANELADKITRSGLEVEEVIKLDNELKDIVVGYVESVEKHPDAEKLKICLVNIGDEKLQIICGASNVASGQYVLVAKVGAKLPNLKIKKAKLRGVESQGMICSLKELGLSQSVIPKNYQDGIYTFNEPQKLGEDAIKILGLNDTIIDISITPNRADALSMRGLVYEVSALYNKKSSFNNQEKNIQYKPTNLSVEIKSDKCTNYLGQVIKNVVIEDSPLWIQKKLIVSGIRPVNNIVDITNLVLLEYGQPMHAFDKDLLGENIAVRQANNGEKLITLDAEERTLTENDLVITDGIKPVALAGVMGGKDTEINKNTKNIILESALFNPVSIRKTSAHHGLRSDSSARFEKGIDPNIQLLALERAVELITALNPNVEVENFVGINKKEEETNINISTNYLNKLLGTTLTKEEVVKILESLSFKVIENNDELNVVVPTRRQDIKIKQDIAEEVIRIYGYDKLPSTLPTFSKATKGGLTYKQKLIKEIREMYLNTGFSDTINYSLVSIDEAKSFTLNTNHLVKLLMPMTETHSTLRQSLISGLLNSLSYNLARQQKNIKLFEIGKVFFGSGDDNIQPSEQNYISAVLTGKDIQTKWISENNDIDFYTTKGYLELLFKKLGILNDISYEVANIEKIHPGRCAKVFYKDEIIGFLGEIHPLIEKELDLSQTYVFEINLDKILKEDKVNPEYTEISKYPTVTRDIAMLIDENDNYSNIYNTIKNINNKLIVNIELFDVYEGIGLPKEKKSIAITISYNNKEKTLTEEEITEVHNKVESALVSYGAIIR